MERKINEAQLRAALTTADVSEDKTRAVMNYLFGVNRPKNDKSPAEWRHLRAALVSDRRRIACNRPSWPVDIKSTYETYLSIMDRVRKDIDLAEFKHGTLTATMAHHAKRNAEREAEGKQPGPTCGPTWQTWVPPHIRDALTAQAEAVYTARPSRHGPRFIPFVPPRLRRQVDKVEANLRTTLQRIRTDYADVDGTFGSTPYRALWLCAVRMAEIQLDKRVKLYEGGVSPVDSPLPVNWRALLDQPMRERMRAAQHKPDEVSAEGLGSFLRAPAGPGHEQH